MAQGTGDQRFLAPTSRTASARSNRALAAVGALLLSGCGGGSSGDSTQSASATAADAAAAGGTQTAPTGEAGAPPSSSPSPGAQDGGKKASDRAAGSGSQDGEGGKHGVHIQPPKGKQEQAPSAAERENSAIADITLTSPDLQLSGEVAFLPSEFTCDGAGRSPSLRWQGVPSGTAELILFAMNTQPVGDKLFFDWAVAGIDPGSTEIQAGALPGGAVVGRSSFGKVGYEICPEDTETYVFALYALPSSLGAKQGFEPHDLRQQVTATSHDVGLMAAAYVRK